MKNDSHNNNNNVNHRHHHHYHLSRSSDNHDDDHNHNYYNGLVTRVKLFCVLSADTKSGPQLKTQERALSD